MSHVSGIRKDHSSFCQQSRFWSNYQFDVKQLDVTHTKADPRIQLLIILLRLFLILLLICILFLILLLDKACKSNHVAQVQWKMSFHPCPMLTRAHAP